MPRETLVYLVNIIIGFILAVLMTHHWRRADRTTNLGYWMVAAWAMTAADVFFAARPELPTWIGRTLPTLLVTVGHGVLLLGAQKAASGRVRFGLVAGVLALHAVGLTAFLLAGGVSKWRMVFNGLIWGGLSLASCLALRRSPEAFFRSTLSPAAVFLLHGLFHALRISLATLFAVLGWSEASASLQIVGDLEVSFFTVALFVSLLIAHLQLRNEELSRALVEVKTLSGLLPICAWRRKVRDDDGYWQQLEDYFTSHSHVKFTHGICADCIKDHFPEKAEENR